LMSSAVGSGLLTFLFWTVIGRREGPAIVGRASAEVSTVTFLASISSLNLINVFARFLPEAGSYSRRFILTGYTASSILAAAVGTVFLLTPWSDRLVVGGAFGRAFFLLMVVAMAIFLIEDGGLIGLGQARFVPVENISVAGGRLVLIAVLFLSASGATTVVIGWALPTVAAVVVVNCVVLLRWSRLEAAREPRLPTRSQLFSFVAIESVTTAVSSSVTQFLPAIVSQTMGEEAAGYFYIPWLVSNSATLLIMAVLISMVRESVAAPAHSVSTVKRSLVLVAGLVLFGSVACIFGGGLFLNLLGSTFAEGAGSLFVWIGLSLPATAIGLTYWSLCLTARKPWPVLAMNLTGTAGIIGGVILLGPGPVDRVGILYCCVQWAIAIAVLIPTYRSLRTLGLWGHRS